MATHPARIEPREAFATIRDALDRLDPDRSQLTDATRLLLVDEARVLAGRLDALLCVLVAEADAAQSAMRAKGTPSTSWLAMSGNLSKKESAGLLFKAQALAANEAVQGAALAGTIGPGQARAIGRVLVELPSSLSESQREQATTALLEYADSFDAGQLAAMSGQVLRQISPESADEKEAERLQRQAETARRNRSLCFVREQMGSVTFRGSLPVVEAEGWIAIIDSYVESQRRTVLEQRDPLAEPLSPQQRRADALLAMIRDHASRRLAPSGGGDRPRVVVTMDYDALHQRAVDAGAISSGQRISAGDLRRLCCDADLIPAVLGGPSEILEVGRTQRLVTRGIRAALVLRDSGCCFPGCETHPTACEAHHIQPWRDGGPTDLSNLALLCHHHHGLVEPDPYGARDQWLTRIAADGVPEFVPPRRVDPERRPIRHQRFLRRAVEHAAGGPTRRGHPEQHQTIRGTRGHPEPHQIDPASRDHRGGRATDNPIQGAQHRLGGPAGGATRAANGAGGANRAADRAGGANRAADRAGGANRAADRAGPAPPQS